MPTAQYPKVVVIGAGSLFFGRQAIWQMTQSPHLSGGTLGLVDTDPDRLQKLSALARKVAAESQVSLRVEASTERREVLPHADFVVLSFADRNVHFRGIDCQVSAKYGIRMCSGDTIGPGGIFRAMREFPEILACARDIESLCPDAWVINYINPTAVHGIGLRRYAPQIRSFALCDSLHMPHVKRGCALLARIIDDADDYTEDVAAQFDLRIAGVNHFTWVLKAAYKGTDVVPAIAESVRQRAAAETDGDDLGAKALFNASIAYALYEVFGYIPACIAHTKEYVRYWQGRGVLPEAIPPLSIWETEPRYQHTEAMWSEIDGYLSGETPIAGFLERHGPDHATDIIESMVGGLGKVFYVNTFNEGAVVNMSDDAFLELLCEVDMDGPRPLPVGEMPRGLRGLQEQVLDTHELTAQAIVACDRALLRRALLTDPLSSSIADGDAIIRELLEAERDAISAGWFI